MQKSQKILIGVGVGVIAVIAIAAIAGPTLYRDVIAPPAAEAPSLSTNDSLLTDASNGSLDPTELAGEWVVRDGSEAGYRVDEVLNGTDVTVTGRTDQVEGSLVIGATGLTLEAADLSVDVASITTDSSSRDAYFHDTAMRVAEHPTAVFALTAPVTFTEAPETGATVDAQAAGELMIAGVTQPVTFDVSVRSDGRLAEIAGAIPITFADFGVNAPSLGFVSVEETGFVEFQLVAEKG
ncbi:MAG: YceI family protein [Leucobacter sp.]